MIVTPVRVVFYPVDVDIGRIYVAGLAESPTPPTPRSAKPAGRPCAEFPDRRAARVVSERLLNPREGVVTYPPGPRGPVTSLRANAEELCT